MDISTYTHSGLQKLADEVEAELQKFCNLDELFVICDAATSRPLCLVYHEMFYPQGFAGVKWPAYYDYFEKQPYCFGDGNIANKVGHLDKNYREVSYSDFFGIREGYLRKEAIAEQWQLASQ